MPKKSDKTEERRRADPPSLAPIPFEEAVSDLLKVKPGPKGKPKAKPAKPRRRA